MADQMMGGMGDPAAAPQDDGSSGGFTVDMHVDGSGAITIEVESADDEAGEDGGMQDIASMGHPGAGQDQGGAQPVASIREALALISSIYANKGQLPQSPEAEQSAAADAFQAARGGK